MVQLDEFKKATEIFSEEYAYFSSMSNSWLAHSKDYVAKMVQDYGIDKDDTIELGPDDGYEFQTESGIVIYKVKFSNIW